MKFCKSVGTLGSFQPLCPIVCITLCYEHQDIAIKSPSRRKDYQGRQFVGPHFSYRALQSFTAFASTVYPVPFVKV